MTWKRVVYSGKGGRNPMCGVGKLHRLWQMRDSIKDLLCGKKK